MRKNGASEKKNNEKTLHFFGLKELLPFLRPYRGRLIAMIILGIVTSVFDTVYPLLNSYALDHFITPGTLKGLSGFILIYILVALLQAADDYFTMYSCGKIEMDMDRDLRRASFNHLQTLSFSYFNQNNVGYIHSRVMSDTSKIGELVAWRMMDFVWNASYLIFVLVTMLVMNARLALPVILMMPVAAVIIFLFQKKLLRLNRQVRELNSKITGDFNEGITGVRSVKTLVIEDLMQKDFEKDTKEYRRTAVRTGHNSALFTSLVTMISSLGLAVVLWRGGLITMEGALKLGELSVFMSYAVGMMEPMEHLIATISALLAIQVNIERFMKLVHEESDVADTPEVVEKYGDNFHAKKENWEPLQGDVEFKDVSFRYPDGDEMVLEHFNLKVPKGTNVAIVGETGAGKSTLVNLVCRFYEPTEGQVLIDGRDARERSQLWLHSNIGYVLQTPHLFSGTVRDNLRYGKEDATDEEIWAALKLVSADGVVKKLEKGLDADVGEGGDLLSTGEKQLLSFARAILADPRLLVLDEATSSIDTMTEKAIQDAIATVIKGRTSFIIAHRLSTVVDSDIILAVKDGRIVEQGTHKELMERHGYYHELYTRQFTEEM